MSPAVMKDHWNDPKIVKITNKIDFVVDSSDTQQHPQSPYNAVPIEEPLGSSNGLPSLIVGE